MTTERQKRSLDPVEEAVQAYFDQNIHAGFMKPFQLLDIIPDDMAKALRKYENLYVTRIQGDMEEAISEKDYPWLNGLSEVGKKFSIGLGLPYWYYEK